MDRAMKTYCRSAYVMDIDCDQGLQCVDPAREWQKPCSERIMRGRQSLGECSGREVNVSEVFCLTALEGEDGLESWRISVRCSGLGETGLNVISTSPTLLPSLSLSLSFIFIRTSVSSFCFRFVLNNGSLSVLPDSPLTSWNRLFPLRSVTTCRKRKLRRPCSAVATLSLSSRRWLKANICWVCVCACVSTDLMCLSH